MKSKDITKQLVPGIVVGLFLGFGLTMLVGVNVENPIPNYIGGAMCCFVPTLLNTIIVLKGTSKVLKRELPIGQALKRAIPYALIGLIIGFLTVKLLVETILGYNTCEITKLNTALYQSVLGVIVSTILAYFALKKYEKDVKYTKRTKKA